MPVKQILPPDRNVWLPLEIEPIAPEKRWRIRFPLEGFNLSGGIRVITQIASGLAARGHTVTLVVPDYQSVTEFALYPMLRLEIIPTGRRGVLRKIEYVLKLTRLALQDCDLCVATSSRTPLYILLSLPQNRNRPKLAYLIQHYEVLSHAEQTARPWPVRKALALLIRFGYRLPFRQVAVSGWIREQIGRPDCAVIPNGVDTAAFTPAILPRVSAPFVLGVIESAAPWKGYALFLEAVNSLSEKEKSEIAVRIASRDAVGLPEGIAAERFRPQSDGAMAEFYRGCDGFVFTSEIEGFGLPPLEAMACGVPVLTTDCGGVREYANDQNAMIVPPKDAAALTDAIRRLINDANLRAKLRAAGLQTAQRYSLDAMLSAHIRWIEAQ